MDRARFEYLWDQLTGGGITKKERQELMRWVAQKENEPVIKEMIQGEQQKIDSNSLEIIKMLSAVQAEEVFRAIVSSESKAPVIEMKKRPFRRRMIFAAAAVLIAVAAGVGLFTYFAGNAGNPVTEKTVAKKVDIAPGRNGAILTLADGSQIVLDDLKDGKLTAAAEKNGNMLSYSSTGASIYEMNTMTVPKGRQYALVLSDGTKVWLNAASSITFPTVFRGKDRRVHITGEAYFEVAHDRSKPFHVQSDGVDVEVLGTSFNINAYADESSVKTTLLEGSVKVSGTGNVRFIKPGEQAQVSNGQIDITKEADLDEVMAWRNGYFSFNDADIKTLMRQVSRWYDIDVSYEGNNREIFSGKIDRNLTLRELLDGLGQAKVHYRIDENRKVVILP